MARDKSRRLPYRLWKNTHNWEWKMKVKLLAGAIGLLTGFTAAMLYVQPADELSFRAWLLGILKLRG